METAFDSIRDTYEIEDLKEIVNHGCQSGVCFKHIYYGDTVSFFDKYEDEITDYIVDNFGTEFLANIFTANNCVLDMYRNDVVWCYIECIASQIIEEFESTTCEELSNEPIKLYANYSKDEVASLTKQGFEVVNS